MGSSNLQSQVGVHISFSKGKLLLSHRTLAADLQSEHPITQLPSWVYGLKKLAAFEYAFLVRKLVKEKIPFFDESQSYQKLALKTYNPLSLRDYQKEAITAWNKNHKRGIVQLPTGAGKTELALFAISEVQRSTLVLVPTLNLLTQWKERITSALNCDVGEISGKCYSIQPVTITTYDSARIHSETIGNLFGLLIFDECHHVCSPSSVEMARSFLAPYRLGLTATPHSIEIDALGSIVYEKTVDELKGIYLAPYETKKILLELTDEERQQYEKNRSVYLEFIQKQGLQLTNTNQFMSFVRLAKRTPDGKRAFSAYRKQKEIAYQASNKLVYLEQILNHHKKEQMIIFTHDNRTTYQISKLFLIPAITHLTPSAERLDILDLFRQGHIQALVTSRVLNEGIDLPEAQVAVVVSGSASLREYIQRLGRILRHRPFKKAMLYELVAKNTSEVSSSNRRTKPNLTIPKFNGTKANPL